VTTGRPSTLACVVLLFTAAVCGAQEQTREEVEPDRPDVTNGTHIVDTGLLQLEIGGLYTHAGASQHALGTPFTARVGLFEWLEARIGTDGLLTQTDGFTSVTGIGNVQVGAKLRLWADPGGIPVLSILPTVNVPAASSQKGLGSGTADYTLTLLTGTDIGRHAHIDVNYGVGSIGAGDSDPRFIQHLVSVSASDAISDNWNPYVEAYWFSQQEASGAAVTAIDAGAIYELGARYAIDGGVQIGISRTAPPFAVFGGISIIVGDILGSHGVHARQRQKQKRAAARPTR
jgi:hypothetical protein